MTGDLLEGLDISEQEDAWDVLLHSMGLTEKEDAALILKQYQQDEKLAEASLYENTYIGFGREIVMHKVRAEYYARLLYTLLLTGYYDPQSLIPEAMSWDRAAAADQANWPDDVLKPLMKFAASQDINPFWEEFSNPEFSYTEQLSFLNLITARLNETGTGRQILADLVSGTFGTGDVHLNLHVFATNPGPGGDSSLINFPKKTDHPVLKGQKARGLNRSDDHLISLTNRAMVGYAKQVTKANATEHATIAENLSTMLYPFVGSSDLQNYMEY